jgi:hypothetical protein
MVAASSGCRLAMAVALLLAGTATLSHAQSPAQTPTPTPSTTRTDATGLPTAGVVTEDDPFAPLPSFADDEPSTDGTDPSAPTSPPAIAAPDGRVTGSVRQNGRIGSVDGIPALSPDRAPEDSLGIRAGRFVLRPAITSRIGSETDRGSGDSSTRTFFQTDAQVELLSDWSRHELRVLGTGRFEENISGEGQTDPEASLDATLRLDLSGGMTGELRAGYDFSREDETDPNALTGATAQAGVHAFSAGAGLQRSFGIIRSSLDLDVERTIYGSAEFADGSSLSLDERDQTAVTVTTRIGYAASPLLIPFIEAAATRSIFDETRDSGGFERSSTGYALRTGVEFDLGEKLFGEISAGYVAEDVDDPRLETIGALDMAANIRWSPRRGTDLDLGLTTVIDSSTAPGLSGNVDYVLSAGITQTVRRNLVARLAGTYTLREFRGLDIEDQNVYAANAGLTWSINRYLDVVGDAFYERTTQDGTEDFDTTRFSVGLTLRR